MPKYRVPLTTWADIAVDVDVPDDVTDPNAIAELAMEQVNVSLCHQCAGSRNDSLTLGDEYSAVLTDGVAEITSLD